VLVRKSAVADAGGYRAIFSEAEDLDLWLRIAERHELANLPETVVRYRIHSDQATVRKLELQSLCALAARLAARARAEGRADPLAAVERIDRDTLVALGATDEEIATTLVRAEAWLARTMTRAGYRDIAEALFKDARRQARSCGSRWLRAYARRERARTLGKHGRWLRAALRTPRRWHDA
jgi:hypothetical protein